MGRLTDRIFQKSARRKRVAAALFKALMDKARDPWLFVEARLPDTLEGRFHAVTLYAGLLFPKLEASGKQGKLISAKLNTRLFDSFDAALRETGVGDASIARKIRKMGEEFFGIGQALNSALGREAVSDSVAEVLVRNEIVGAEGASALATRLVQADKRLRAAGTDRLLAGDPGWEDPPESAA